MSTLSSTVEAPRVPVLADLVAKTWVVNAVLVLGGALFTALCAQITIPMTPVPMTGQTLAVMLVGAALGWKRGMAARSSISPQSMLFTQPATWCTMMPQKAVC